MHNQNIVVTFATTIQNLNLQMDIVSRLKIFISYINIPVTQFADNCKIPRPTLSQLLNGRNKKVSDELISKIHEAYPQLSVLWLMFGEGNMLHNSNIQTSEPQNSMMIDFGSPEESDSEPTTPLLPLENTLSDNTPNIITTEKIDTPTLDSTLIDSSSDSSNDTTNDTPTTFTLNSNQDKKIVNIIIYYNDNSFESFVPAHNK